MVTSNNPSTVLNKKNPAKIILADIREKYLPDNPATFLGSLIELAINKIDV